MMRPAIITLVFMVVTGAMSAQSQKLEWYLNANTNIYIPGGNSEKGVYPVLGYNKNTSPKILLGGIGVGSYAFLPLSNSFNLKIHGQLSKLSYWDDPVLQRDHVGNDVGLFRAGGSDYMAGLGAILHYNLNEQLSVGAGLGTQILLVSLSRTPGYYGYGVEAETSTVTNKYYKRVLPVLPIELAYHFPKIVLNLRYDVGLMNRLKGRLADVKSEKFDVLSLEIAFKLK